MTGWSLSTLPSDAAASPRSRHVRRMGRIAFGVCYVIMACEVFLRLFAPQALMPRYVCAGSNGIRANEPNKSYWHTAPSFHVNIRINPKGIRADRDIPYEKPEGLKRILVLGDSYGIGYGVNVEDTFAMILERTLRDKGISCEVINLSVSGFGSAEELIMLETEGMKYHPDLAVFQFNSADPRETMASGLYALSDNQLVRANKTYLPAVHIQKMLSGFSVYRFLSEHSQLYVLLREQIAEFAKRRVVPGIRLLAPKSSGSDPVPTRRSEKVGEEGTYNDRLTLAVLKAVQGVCQKAGVQFMVVDIPADRGRFEYISNEFWAWNPVRTSGLPVHYSADDFQAYRGQELFDPWSNSHLTPLGNRITGEGLARFILEQHLIVP